MVQVVDPKHEWAGEIGRIVISFGSIEHVTMVCLRQVPRDPIYTATSHLNLAPRLDLLMAVLVGSPDPNASELAQLFAEARALAEERNLIVHNPLMLEVYEDGNGGYDFQHAIQSMRRTEKRLTLADLTRFREKVERLAAELYRVATPILQRRRTGGAETRSADA